MLSIGSCREGLCNVSVSRDRPKRRMPLFGLCGSLAAASLTAAIGLVLAGSDPALAVDWTGSTSSDWFTGTNWVGGAPTGTTDVWIRTITPNPPVIGTAGAQAKVVFDGLSASMGDLTIEGGGTLSSVDSHLGSDSGSTGTATVTGAGSDWTNSGNFYVGDFGTGTLTIEDGASASDSFGFIGAAIGSTGSLTVTGAGSSFSNTNNLYVGSSGNGTLEIRDDGTVSDTLGLIGVENGSIGVATVDGQGSSWNNSSDLYVGVHGNGTLQIQNGASVTSAQGQIGINADAVGAVTVDGTGSSWTNSGDLIVGNQGAGTLDILNGGEVANASSYIGNQAGSTGAVTVDGSSWTNSGDLNVGNVGTGTLTIQNGGKVANANGTIGYLPGATGTVTVNGANSSWTNSGSLHVGSYGAGTLIIQNGGTVSSINGYVSAAGGALGNVTVDGAGSSWVNSGIVNIGIFDTGTLTIRNGGKVTNTLSIVGYFAGVTGTVTVDGANSTWVNSGDLTLGYNGDGTLTIQSGGKVTDTSGYIGNNAGSIGNATVDGASSTWINSGNLYVGNLGAGTLNIQNGGQVSNATGYIGYGSGSTGAVTVDGAGSSWTVDGALTVADAGTGSLTVRNGATVDVGATLTIASASGSTGTVNIGAAAGDAATAAGTLSASQVTFGQGSGTLVFNHTSTSYDFAAPLSGNGSVRQLAGFTNLTGNSAGFMGTTTVEGGTLAVNGSLGGALDVLAAGRLQGGGTIGGTVVAGTVAPGNSIGTINVVGDIEFKAGSTYEVEIDAAGQGDRIAASGTATIGGGTVEVLNAPGTYVVGTRYTILTATSGLTGSFVGLTQAAPLSTPFLSFTLNYDASAAYLDVTRSDLTFGSIGTTPNQRAVGGGLDSLPLSSPLLNAVSQLDTASVQSALDQLSGEIHASIVSSLIEDSHFVRDVATDRLRSAFDTAGATELPVMSYASDGPDLVPATTDLLAVWGQGFGSWGHADGDGNAARLGRSTGGFFIGADGVAFETWRLGLLAGYSRTDFDVTDRGSSGESDNYHVGIYGGTRWGDLALRAGAAYSWHDIRTDRSVDFTGFADSLKDDYHAGTGQVFGELGTASALAVWRSNPSPTSLMSIFTMMASRKPAALPRCRDRAGRPAQASPRSACMPPPISRWATSTLPPGQRSAGVMPLATPRRASPWPLKAARHSRFPACRSPAMRPCSKPGST